MNCQQLFLGFAMVMDIWDRLARLTERSSLNTLYGTFRPVCSGLACHDCGSCHPRALFS